MTSFGDLNLKIPLILDVLILLSNSTFMRSCVEHEKSFITSGPGHEQTRSDRVYYFLFVGVFLTRPTRDLHLSHNTLYLLSPRLCFFIVLKRDLFFYHDDSLTS